MTYSGGVITLPCGTPVNGVNGYERELLCFIYTDEFEAVNWNVDVGMKLPEQFSCQKVSNAFSMSLVVIIDFSPLLLAFCNKSNRRGVGVWIFLPVLKPYW